MHNPVPVQTVSPMWCHIRQLHFLAECPVPGSSRPPPNDGYKEAPGRPAAVTP